MVSCLSRARPITARARTVGKPLIPAPASIAPAPQQLPCSIAWLHVGTQWTVTVSESALYACADALYSACKMLVVLRKSMTDQTPRIEALSSARNRAARKGWPVMLLSIRPCKLAILAFTIAVAGWSSASRISQFVYHSDPLHRLPLAKALPEHRFAEAAPTWVRLRHRVHNLSETTAVGPVHGLRRIVYSLIARAPLALSARRHCFFKAGLALRSPPALA